MFAAIISSGKLFLLCFIKSATDSLSGKTNTLLKIYEYCLDYLPFYKVFLFRIFIKNVKIN